MYLIKQKYVKDLLQKFGLDIGNFSKTPMKSYHIPSKCDDTTLVDHSSYRGLVDTLQYCVLTEPNVTFSVNKFC